MISLLEFHNNLVVLMLLMANSWKIKWNYSNWGTDWVQWEMGWDATSQDLKVSSVLLQFRSRLAVWGLIGEQRNGVFSHCCVYFLDYLDWQKYLGAEASKASSAPFDNSVIRKIKASSRQVCAGKTPGKIFVETSLSNEM